MKKSKLLLIDSSAFIYRAFYALPPLTDKKGQVVNAVYGFMSAFLNVLKQTNPSYVIFAFDSPKPTFRKKKYAQYKAQREKAPDELYSQIPLVKELVKKFGFVKLEKSGFEADDIIATCAKMFLKKYSLGEVVIATGDLDTLQLVTPEVKIFALSRGITEAKIYDNKAIQERFGLKPVQMNDFKALFGDPSDNIKGVKGVGKKTAAELLQKYETLEGIYKNLDKLKPRIRELLTQEKEQAFLSKELVTLCGEIPLEFDWENSLFKMEQLTAGKKYLLEYSFNSLANRIDKLDNTDNQLPVGGYQSKQKLKVENQANIDVILSSDDLKRQVIPAIGKNKRFILWFSGGDKKNSLVIGVIENKKIIKIFSVSSFLTSEINRLIPKESQGFGFGLKEIGKYFFPARRLVRKSEDLKLMAYLIQPPLIRKFSLKEVIWHFLKERWEEPKKQLSLLQKEESGYGNEKITELTILLGKLVPEVEETFREQINFQDESKFIPEIFPEVEDKVRERSIKFIYEKIEKPLGQVLGLMEMAGIKINLGLLQELREKNAGSISALKEKIFNMAGKEFNLDSPSQLADILFGRMNINTLETKKGKSGHYSTAANVLEKLEGKHPIISFLLKYREQRKFQTTYLDVIPKLVDKSWRLHTSFDQTGTVTGRLSSNSPNLQNIPLQPIDKAGKIGIRDAFMAEEGFSLISLDYSQIEIRLAAYLTGEKKLIEAFERGEDIHQRTAAFVNNIDPEKVDSNMRNAAKALNFGIMYGMSSFGFAQSSKLPEAEARIFIQNYFREFPRIANYINNVKQFASEYGFVETVFGRRRYTPEVNLDNRILRQAGERMAVNMPFQGTAADIMKMALIEVNKFIEDKYTGHKAPPLERDVRILLTIHDEIILEVKNNLAEQVAKEIQNIMENIVCGIIPLKVNIKTGKTWGEI